MNTLTKKQPKQQTMFLNPLIKKLGKINETSEDHVTYAGIFQKCLYFIGTICAGILLCLVLNGFSGFTADPVTDNLNFSLAALFVLIASVLIFLIVPFIAFLIRRTIPVTGALYCMATGYFLTFLMLFDEEMGSYILLALALTIAVVVSLGILFAKGLIQVTKKFRTIVSTLFMASILGSLLLLICFFIPGLREIVLALQNNMLLSVGGSILGIIIAAAFLLVDFQTIKESVENHLPKKYEWYAAFSMVFTVIWLYFKILDLIQKAKD